jgi:quercetin dioxygenase-like cupin family protein
MAFESNILAVPHVQHDDEVLRITRWDFAPGAVTTWHRHAWPYFVTMLVAGTLRIDDGETIREVALFTGESYTRPAGIEHNVQNASPHAISFVEIEIKNPAALFAGQPPTNGSSPKA